MAKYCALFSGSKGNCTYVGTTSGGILIDAGVSAKRIKEALIARDIDPTRIQGVCITHEHKDHIAGLRVLTKQFGWTVYASQGTLNELILAGEIDSKSDVVPLQNRCVTIGDMCVTPFRTPHDAAESMGFCIETPDERRVGVATDMGVMREAVRDILKTCDLVHIESNHDLQMLRQGPYPFYLQERILSNEGHLSNVACAATVVDLAAAGVCRFTLAHISEQNNTPLLALQTTRDRLLHEGFCEGVDFDLEAAAPVSQQALTIF